MLLLHKATQNKAGAFFLLTDTDAATGCSWVLVAIQQKNQPGRTTNLAKGKVKNGDKALCHVKTTVPLVMKHTAFLALAVVSCRASCGTLINGVRLEAMNWE